MFEVSPLDNRVSGFLDVILELGTLNDDNPFYMMSMYVCHSLPLPWCVRE